MSLEERRSALEAARRALDGFEKVLYQAPSAELAGLMALADAVAAKAGAARVAVTVEALARGEVAASGVNAHCWVREHAPTLRQGGAGDVAKVAVAVASPGSVWRPEGFEVDPDSPLGIVWAGVRDGVVAPGMATAVLRELERLEPLLVREAKPTVYGESNGPNYEQDSAGRLEEEGYASGLVSTRIMAAHEGCKDRRARCQGAVPPLAIFVKEGARGVFKGPACPIYFGR